MRGNFDPTTNRIFSDHRSAMNQVVTVANKELIDFQTCADLGSLPNIIRRSTFGNRYSSSKMSNILAVRDKMEGHWQDLS